MLFPGHWIVPPPPPCNPNNVEPYTFVPLFLQFDKDIVTHDELEVEICRFSCMNVVLGMSCGKVG